MAVDLDPILNELGQFGRYQIRNYCLILILIVFSAVYNTQYIFSAGDVNYRCKVPECESSPPQYETNGWGSYALPESGRCERLVPVGDTCAPDSFLPNDTQACDAWLYEKDTTIVAEFGLACNDWKRTLVGTLHSSGNFASLLFISSLSDNFGRKWVLLFSAVAPALVGVARAFSVSYIMYVVLEFLEAMVGGGLYTTCFVLALEMVGLKKRVLGGNLISCTWALGQVVAALVAWAFPFWQTYTLIIYAPSFLFIVYYWLIEESIRWLLSRGNKKEAARIIFKVAEYNNKKLSPESIKALTEEETEKQREADSDTVPMKLILKQVIHSRVILCRLLVCSVWWITLTFTYYGLSINSVSLAGNMYVNYILTALVEIPGYFMSFVCLDRFGRKRSIMSAYFICAASLLALPFSPATQPWMRTMFNMIGKLSISMAFSSVYIYTGELFPTQARHMSLGACSTVGRIGSIIAPQTPLLMAYMEALPYLIFGSLAALSGLLMILTPETLNTNLPDTIDQAENINSKKVVTP